MKRTRNIFIAIGFFASFFFASCASVPVSESEPEEKAVEVKETKTESPKEDMSEYKRSTANVSVSKDVFDEDKERIISIIKKLDLYMKNQDYHGWLTCLDEESKNYWSRRGNLQKVSNMLPKKGMKLETLEDYFLFVFIPSRKGHKVEEIRYENKSFVKAVEVQNDRDIVYYYFKKVDGQWKLDIPTNID